MKYSSHSTYFNKENEEVPSVTTILKILNKPSLIKWANFMGFKRKNIQAILDESSFIGTMVHKCIESYLMKELFIYIEVRPYTKMVIMKYLNQFINWKNNQEIVPNFMEKQFSCDKFGGTVDFYGEVNGKQTILDFKTSKSVYSSMFLQLGAYCYMLELHGYSVEQAGIVTVRDTQCFSTIKTREELQDYIDIFLVLSNFFHLWYDKNVNDGWGDILV